MNMHTQSATNRRRKQQHERDLHAYNPGARRPKFVRSHSLAPIASKKFGLSGLAIGTVIGATARPVYPPPPVYVEREEACFVERRRVWVPGWGWEFRRRTVCE
jgi:hypothetical protein